MALVLGLSAGLACGAALGSTVKLPPWLFALALVPLVIACTRRSPSWLWSAAFLVATALTSPPSFPPPVLRQLPLLQEINGRVVGMPEPHRASLSFVLEPAGLRGRLLVYLRGGGIEELPVNLGDQVQLRGEGALAQGGWREYLARRGIAGLFWADEMELLRSGRSSPLRTVSRWRMELIGRLARLFPGEGGELLSALLLGARGLLPGEAKQAFRTAGVAHLLALSGLHLGILAALGWSLLGLVRIRRGWRYLLLLPLVWGYVLLGGARISLVRAGIMFTLLGLFYLLWERGLVLKRWHDPLEGLGLAAVVVLVLWPWSALDLGFQLSFAATFAILLLWPGWGESQMRGRLPRPLRWGADLLAASAFAQAGTIPLVGSAFGYIAPWGLLANLLLIPWTGVILGAGLVILAISPFPWAVGVGDFLARTLISPYLGLVQWLAALPGAALPVGPGFGFWCLLCMAGVLVLRELSLEAGEGPGTP